MAGLPRFHRSLGNPPLVRGAIARRRSVKRVCQPVKPDPALSPVLPDTVPLKDRPQFAKGVYVQEVFAGWGGWTQGMLHQGFRADTPIEYFEDPLMMQGPCPEHDLRDATVRARLLEKAKAPPEADVPNLWEWGTPCTTFCDFQCLNGGTRTALHPEGAGTRADEMQGNDFAEFASELCLELHRAGRVFGFESSAPSGNYPKIWDLPCMKRLREETGARIVPMHMCAWFLQPSSCQPGEFHKKATWWTVSPELFPWVHLFLSRRCPGVSPSHVHVPLQGPSYLAGVPATRVAQQYTVPLCAAWGLAVRAAVEQWDWRQYLAGRHAVQALEIYTARSGAPGCPPVDFCDPDRVLPTPLPVLGGRKLADLGSHVAPQMTSKRRGR